MTIKKKAIIGWEEWCALPELGLPAIKAKIDTGAKTSALHAYDIKTFKQNGEKHVRFKIHPLQKDKKLERQCSAPLVAERVITSSNGEREKRYVIATPIVFGNMKIRAEITLTARHKMSFRMLLGREALRKAKFIVDSSKTYTRGKIVDPRILYEPQESQQK